MIRQHRPAQSPAADGGLALAIQAAGGSVRLAAVLGMTRQAVEQTRRLNPERLLLIERATGLPRHEMRPDLYEGYVRLALPRRKSSSE